MDEDSFFELFSFPLGSLELISLIGICCLISAFSIFASLVVLKRLRFATELFVTFEVDAEVDIATEEEGTLPPAALRLALLAFLGPAADPKETAELLVDNADGGTELEPTQDEQH